MSLDLIIDAASWALLVAGGFFLVVGAIGLNRMPDLYTRLHATSVSDSAGAGLLLIGMMLQAGLSLVTVKLLVILALFFFTTPVATHAVTRAALAVGVWPLEFGRDGVTREGAAAAYARERGEGVESAAASGRAEPSKP